MIDPEKVTNYNQTDRQLEEFILFWVCAAGKNGRTASRCLNKLLNRLGAFTHVFDGPFHAIRSWTLTDAMGYPSKGSLPDLLKEAGIGCYTSKAGTFLQLSVSGLNLKTCTVSDLESIHGIGPKTARCFALHSRKNAQVAGLDTHMLKHLRALGYDDIPKSTPTGNKYLTNEKRVLSLAKEAGMTPAQYDLHIWTQYSIKSTPRG